LASSLFQRSLAFLLAAVLAAAVIFAIIGLSVLGATYAKANSGALGRAATALAAALPSTALSDRDAAVAFAKAASSGGYRVTLIAVDGKVLADSEADSTTMENHATRPEVASALAGRVSNSRRVSATVGEDLLYGAAPIKGADRRIAGVLRLALHEPSLERALSPARWTLGLAVFLFALAAFAAAAVFSRMMARPLASLAKTARAYGSGEINNLTAARRAIRADDPEEIRLLATTLDSMAAEIGKRMAAAEAQGKKLEAILDAMAEAVLALDSSLRITVANPAATALFGLEGDAGAGLLEATRSNGLQAVAADCLVSGKGSKTEISLFLPYERVFQVFVAPLTGAAPLRREASSPKISAGSEGEDGVVIVLNDITELRRLERVRSDFVANVSHELRTPVQLVKGFAETLSEGALDDREQAQRFLGIIGRNASRMESLISDLLSLASLEREGRDWLKLEIAAIMPILRAAREAIAPKADARGTEVRITCEEVLAAKVDAGLLEQAVINLIDNAVKYSPPATAVDVGARSEGGRVVIEVRDRGMGIPARDLPRVFERFYRVDKARSRELGGTGLGLAIVRHIALVHGGEVSVESWEGEGSTFRIKLPLA
jgi:two-component system phosphate regulon sensor histidine kinase PhoR